MTSYNEEQGRNQYEIDAPDQTQIDIADQTWTPVSGTSWKYIVFEDGTWMEIIDIEKDGNIVLGPLQSVPEFKKESMENNDE